MKITVRALSAHFGLPEEIVRRLLCAVLEVDEWPLDEPAILDAAERAMMIDWLADNSARCVGCDAAPEPVNRVCTCRRELGRCPVCLRRTSFSLLTTRWFGRSDYRCDACSADVAHCKGQRAQCGWWAPLVAGVWRDFCPSCESDPQRLIDERAERAKLLESLATLSNEIGKAHDRHQRATEARESRNARLLDQIMRGPPKNR